MRIVENKPITRTNYNKLQLHRFHEVRCILALKNKTKTLTASPYLLSHRLLKKALFLCEVSLKYSALAEIRTLNRALKKIYTDDVQLS